MSFHRNAKLVLAGRYALVRAIQDGLTLKAAAAAFSVSPATAHRRWHRWLDAGEEARTTLACLLDRSSRPRHSPASAGAAHSTRALNRCVIDPDDFDAHPPENLEMHEADEPYANDRSAEAPDFVIAIAHPHNMCQIDCFL